MGKRVKNWRVLSARKASRFPRSENPDLGHTKSFLVIGTSRVSTSAAEVDLTGGFLEAGMGCGGFSLTDLESGQL
jgi:hypothetical protein